jgi:hypothetical protein
VHERFVPDSANVTVPVGEPDAEVTVAVKVVVLFGLDAKLGLTLELKVVVVDTLDAEIVRTSVQLLKETAS